MLLVALTMVCGSVFAQDEPTTVLWEAASGDALTTIYPDGNISLKWEEGGGDFAPKYSGESVLFYNGNRLTVAGKTSDVTIKEIVFTFSSGSASLVLCDKSGKNESSTGIVNSYSGMTSTWTGEANSLIFRAAKQTNNRYISSIKVTYTGGTAGPVVTAPELNISNNTLGETYDMDQNGVFVVYAKNDGTAAAQNAKLSVLVDGAENTAWEIGTLAIGEEKWQNMKFDVTSIEAGSHAVKLSLTADNAEAVSVEKTVNFTKKAPEATFTVSAPAAINVEYGQESFNIEATVKNTSEVNATDVVITLWNNGAIDTKTISELAAGAETQVTFTVTAPEGGFTPGRTVSYYVQAPKNQSQATVEVTFAEQPVEDVKSLEIAEINGTIKLGEESNSLRVTINNTGTVDIADATVVLTTGETTLGQGTISATAGQQGWTMIAVDKTGLEAGTITVKAVVTVDAETTAEKTAEITVEAAPVPEATLVLTAADKEFTLGVDELNFTVNVKNTSEVDAENVNVNIIYRGIITIATKNIAKLAAGESTDLVFTAADVTIPDVDASMLPAGTYNLSAMTDGNKFGTNFTITVKKPEEKVVDIALIDIRGLENINLKSETNAVQVWFTDNSTVDELNAAITLTMNSNEVGTQTITKGAQYVQFTLPTEGLVAGETAALVATLTAENNKEGNLAEVTKTLDIVSGEATEAAIVVNVENVEVLTTDAKVKVVVNVKNDSEVKAEQFEVKILKGMEQLGESKYVFGLEAGAEQNVTIEFANFSEAGTYELQAVAGNVGKFFNVVVKEPAVELAVESITGTLDLANTSNTVTVTVKNNGEADVKDAVVTLTAGETVLGTATIATVKAGEQGYGYVQVASEGLTAGDLEVKAVVAYAEDKTAELTATLTVKAAPEAQATFTVSAGNVTVAFGAESFDIKATVKNTSEVAGEVEVKLLKGMTTVETKTVTVAAGAEAEVTFTVNEIGEAGKTATYYVQAGTSQAEVTVTFAEQETVKANDLAIESITGTIDLANTSNNVTVIVKNNGEVDAKNVKATLTFGETTLEKEIASIKAGEQGYAYFQVASEGITGETLAVTAAIDYADDNADNNTLAAELTVKAAPAAEPTFSLTADDVEVTAGQAATAIIKVTNTSEVDANGVDVKLIYGMMTVATQTVDIAAGETKNVEFTLAAEMVDQVLAMIGDKTSAEIQAQAGNSQCFFNVTVKKEETPVVDIALIDIRGIQEINLKEENTVMVTFQNQSNTDIDATITLKMNGNEVGTQTIAKKETYKSFTLSTEGLVAGQEVELVATLNVENNKEGNLAEVTKTLNVVSGEAEPQAVIALNPVADQVVESAGEQTINVNVGVFNNGDADAENVEVKLYQEISTVLASKTVNIKKGESAIVSLSFTYDIQKATEFHVAAYLDNVLAAEVENFTVSIEEEMADMTIAKIADIEATTEEEVKIAATVKNVSAVDAERILVDLYQGMNKVEGLTKVINELAAGAEATVEFNVGQLEAGTYNYTVQITSIDANTENNTQSVTVKVSEPVEQKVEVALTQIQGSQIDLASETNTITVWVENTGTEAAEATISVTLNGTALEAQTVSVAAGKNGHAQFTLPTEGLVAGEKATVVATVAVEGNTAQTTTMTQELDIIDSSVATEPAFEVSAADVEVEMGAEKFDVVATVKNITAIDAANVTVQLFYNGVIAEQTIAALAGNTETTVTFADVENTFTKADTYAMSVMVNGKAVGTVNIIVKEAAVEPVVELAITGITGTLSTTAETNYLTVSVENRGNVDVTDAAVSVKIGEKEYTGTVSAKAGTEPGTGICSIAVPGADLAEGDVDVVATVTVEGNTSEAYTMTKTFTVAGTPVAEPEFSVTAEAVTVPFGAESFEIKATVKNTSEVAANGLTVKLLQGATTVEEKTLNITLEAGQETEVSFTVTGSFTAGTTATYYVQVDGKAQAEVSVTFEAEPVEQYIDLAVTAISGTLSLDVENNPLTVSVQNNGTVDVNNATVTVTIGEKQYTGTVNVKAGDEPGTAICTVNVPAADLTAGELTVVATVTAEGEADDKLGDNSLTKNYTIAAAAAELSFTVEAAAGTLDATIPVKVTVSNSEKAAAENVAVTVYDANGNKLGEATIAAIAAGDEATATINIENTYTAAGEYRNALQVTVAGVEGAKWVTITITEGTVGIAALKAVYGENVQIFTLSGKKVNDVRRGIVYIVNGKKVVIK
jgi:hypothetical protein